jgi:hypothetical protein
MRRSDAWLSANDTVTGKVFMGLTSVLRIGGLIAAVVAPLALVTAKVKREKTVVTSKKVIL